ncbi:hypothetical protein ACIPK9_26145 [Streptomyces sp. NPDC086771]|uniref:hypothetical protein n=1 Tax=unclassified Streptomyces TaxID=2593676 RepID=UPI0037F79FE4
MSLADLRHVAELVRRGPGNETERLRLLDAHRPRVDARIQALEEHRSVIAGTAVVHVEHLARGKAGGPWDPTARGKGADPCHRRRGSTVVVAGTTTIVAGDCRSPAGSGTRRLSGASVEMP